jgi:aspartate kinase
MQVYKFGGASVKDVESIKNVGQIIHKFAGRPLVMVVSAMAKTTNALEELTSCYMEGDDQKKLEIFNRIKKFHFDIVNGLFPDKHPVTDLLEQSFFYLQRYIEEKPSSHYNFEYDRIVSTGEIVSTQIISAWLNHCGVNHLWYPASKLIITDGNFRDARVDWILTEQAVQKALFPFIKPAKEDNSRPDVILTQGFLGGTQQGFTTTLGREGSDFTAAILAYTLNASEVVIWKDVPGLLNADPKLFNNTRMLPNISYQEAIELSYYGATVIHPKTLKPLFSRNIPLKVKSFFDPESPGTIINQNNENDAGTASYIMKFNQVLTSIFPKDFSFIAEQNLSRIFSEFARHGVKINLMQNSAISFSVCFDRDRTKTPALLRDLSRNFEVKSNFDLDLITIRHYDKAEIEPLLKGKQVLLEQKSRTTLQMVVSNQNQQPGN